MAPVGAKEMSHALIPSGDGSVALTQAQASGPSMTIVQANNQKAAQYFAIAIAGLIVILSALHWSRLMHKSEFTRKIRGILMREFPGFSSYGHFIVVLAYLAINITLSVINVQWSSLTGIAKRCGWMAISNVAFVTVLALKNTPLALLTSYSYERLNPLHQVGGYATIAYAFLHMTLMCASLYRMHKIRIVLMHSQINGMIAVSSLFVILITASFVRRMRYETFYFTHILMYMLVIVNIGMHRPSYALKVAIITTFAGSIWASDRIIRGCRLLLYFRHNSATITALPHGGTRVVLHCHPSRAIPGTHCFLWIPQIKWIETHPFTIASATPESLEFVVAAHDGFTKELYHYAQLHPGAKLRASVDGPYGVLPPSMHNADKLVMIAGGSGASFTFGVALDTIRELGESRKTSVEFIWTVKEYESFSWFANELAELQASPIVTLRLYTTSSATPRGNIAVIESLPTPGPVVSSNDEGQTYRSKSVPPITVKHDSSVDLEKAPALTSSDTLTETVAQRTPWASTATLNTISGRPDVRTIIKDIVSEAQDIDRIVIAACGPPGLMTAVRSTTANLIQGQGPTIEMYCETFGW